MRRRRIAVGPSSEAQALARAACLAGAALLVGCSQPTEVQPFAGSCPAFEPVAWQPAGLEQDISVNTTFAVTFSDFPEPDTVNGSSLLLTTGIYWHTGSYSVDLVSRTVRFRPPVPLRPRLGYTLTVFPALRSLQGCPTSLHQRSFRAGDQTVAVPPPPSTPFSAVLPILRASCGGVGCHRPAADAPDACLTAPARGLSLCDAEAYDALVDVPSRELSRLRLVTPRDSSRSFLLRKLLSTGDSALRAPTTPGHRDPPGAPLDPQSLRTIADWIDTGAVR